MDLSLNNWLVIISSVTGILGLSVYAYNTLKGQTRPNRVTWFMWGLAPILGAIIAYYSGADTWVTWRTFLAGLLPMMIFVLSFFNPQSYWKLGLFDFLCGACALISIILWTIFHSSDTAIILLVIADLFASFPTISKSWSNPETETGLTYIVSALGLAIVFPSIPLWDIKNAAFQIYLVLINAVIAFIIFRKRRILA